MPIQTVYQISLILLTCKNTGIHSKNHSVVNIYSLMAKSMEYVTVNMILSHARVNRNLSMAWYTVKMSARS